MVWAFLSLLPVFSWAYQLGDTDVSLRAGASLAYDDNITFARDNRKSDSSTDLSLGLDAKYEGKTRSLGLSANLNHQFFQTYSNFDHTSENASLTYNQEFSKYSRMSLQESFSHTQEPRSFADEFGRTSGRYSYITNRLGLDYTHELSRQLSLIARFSNDLYDPSRSDLSRSSQNRASLEADYALSSRTITYAGYSLIRRDFSPGSDALFNILFAGLREYFTTQLFLDAGAGFNFIRSFNGRNYNRPFLQLALTDDFNATDRASLTLTKNYTANAYTQDLFNYWQVSCAFLKQVFPRLSLNADIFYGQGTYSAIDIKDKLSGSSLGLGYELWHNTKATLQYSFSQAKSNDSGRDYKRNYVSAGLTMNF
jgi:hypothetical protein